MRYRVYFAEWVKKFYYVDVDATSSNEAMKLVDYGRHIHLPIHLDTNMGDVKEREAIEYEELPILSTDE